jgi:tetratricopeptide (TPR) repeat protein
MARKQRRGLGSRATAATNCGLNYRFECGVKSDGFGVTMTCGADDGLCADLAQIGELLKDGDTKAAIRRCQTALIARPDDLDVLRLIALAHMRQSQFPEAFQYLSRALRLAPRDPGLMTALGTVKISQKAYPAAMELFQRALKIDHAHGDALSNLAATYTLLQQPGNAKPHLQTLARVLPYSPQVHVRAASNAAAVNDVADAIRYARKAVRLAPEHAPARLVLAEALEANGRFKQAKFQYLAVLTTEPEHATALSKLLSLKATHVAERHVRDAHRLLDGADGQDPNQVPLRLALAQYHDLRGQYDIAFKYLQTANEIRHKRHAFDSAAQTSAVDRLIYTCTASALSALPPHTVRSEKPIFIIGMPRSGTTLVEQILSSHPQVAAGGELPTLINIVRQIKGAGTSYPEATRGLDRATLEGMARRYLDKLDGISRDALRVTDKMPFNYMHLWLIAALHPDATIVHCRREALDTCLSCYFTSFNEELQFASDLDTLGRYWIDYCRLMQHWRAVLPHRFIDLDYERLVTDTEGSIRELLAFCHLPWEARCMKFYESHRGVRTPSRWQVRQPIYRQSVGRWRNYERHLQPLINVLHPQRTRLRSTAMDTLGT